MRDRITSRSGFLDLRVLFALLFCAAATLLGFSRAETVAGNSQRSLTFKERVAYQQAIEEVYWKHRIWPRPEAKPSLDAAMTQAQLEKKVAQYLLMSQVLEDHWQRPIDAQRLQAEIDRMAKHTRQPDVLHKLFEALGNDPFVIAECLARPVLTERLVADLPTQDNRGRFETAHSKELRSVSTTTTVANGTYTLPSISEGNPPCTGDTWTPTSVIGAPNGRQFHTAVWTGSEMIVWGGNTSGGYFNTGGRYNPATDSWIATSTINAPTGRWIHTAVWTGSEMIVWGGSGSNDVSFNSGGRYNPGTDTWTATNIADAPAARGSHTAIWTGSEMIVWGGTFFDGQNNYFLKTGGRYNPGTDTWTATSITNVPDGRFRHTAVWSGSEMIVWGGWDDTNPFNTGGRYNPDTDTWTATGTTNVPLGRFAHTAVWTGSEMIVWGGYSPANPPEQNTGGRYNPDTDSWTATSTTDAPQGRDYHTAVWTGCELIIWGGETFYDGSEHYLNTGGRYNPDTDSWTATSNTNVPDGRAFLTAIWTGNEMIVWGGYTGGMFIYFNTGARYGAEGGSTPTPTPTATPTATATPTSTPRTGPSPRSRPTPAPRPIPR
jgi:N-acetylneuraminic acid mutarotase